jgi:hypothetical protein
MSISDRSIVVAEYACHQLQRTHLPSSRTTTLTPKPGGRPSSRFSREISSRGTGSWLASRPGSLELHRVHTSVFSRRRVVPFTKDSGHTTDSEDYGCQAVVVVVYHGSMPEAELGHDRGEVQVHCPGACCRQRKTVSIRHDSGVE